MTDQNPTAARNAYLAQVLANPPASRQPCAANCDRPLTQWHTDAEGRRWHPDCLTAGTPMPITRSDREWHALLDEATAETAWLRTGMEDLFTRWFLNAHAGLGLREAMPGIAADLRSILDNPTQTTPDNPPTSSDAANNPGEPR